MESRVMYEQRMLEEIKGLSTRELGHLLKLVHFVKEEFLPSKIAAQKITLTEFAGCLTDLSDDQRNTFDEAISRRSLFADREPLV